MKRGAFLAVLALASPLHAGGRIGLSGRAVIPSVSVGPTYRDWEACASSVMGGTSTAWAVGDIVMRASVNGPDMSAGKTFYATSGTGSLASGHDGNPATYWTSGTTMPAGGHCIGVDFGSPVSVAEMVVYPSNGSNDGTVLTFKGCTGQDAGCTTVLGPTAQFDYGGPTNNWNGAVRRFTFSAAPTFALGSYAQPATNLHGVNIEGLSFNGFTYFPATSDADFYLSRGFNLFRIPIVWTNAEPTLYAALDSTYMTNLDVFVNYATAAGAYVVIEDHSYGNMRGDPVAFAYFEGLLAARYKTNPKVILGPENEPNIVWGTWGPIQQAVILAVRATGAKNIIGVTPQGSQPFYSTGEQLATLYDPLNNLWFEFHKYLDPGGGGGAPECAAPGIYGIPARYRLAGIDGWLASRPGRRGYLGEFAAGSPAASAPYPGTAPGTDSIDQCGAELNGTLDIVTNASRWGGWTGWGGAPQFAGNIFSMYHTTGSDNAYLSTLEARNVP